MRASFKTRHSFTYVNEYERFKVSLYNPDFDDSELWEELDRIYDDLKKDMRENSDIYLKLSKD